MMDKKRKIAILFRRYPYIRVTVAVGALTMLFFILSLVTDQQTRAGSLISNIFAGLFSGLTLSFIASFKNRDIRDLCTELDFFMKLHERFLAGSKAYYDYLGCRSTQKEEYYETIYNLVSEMNAFEETLRQGDCNSVLIKAVGKNPSEFLNYGQYSYQDQKTRYERVIELLNNPGQSPKEEIHSILKDAFSAQHIANNRICMEIRRIQKDVDDLSRSVF